MNEANRAPQRPSGGATVRFPTAHGLAATPLNTRGGQPITPAKIVNRSFGDGGLSLSFLGIPGHETSVESAPPLRSPWNERARLTTGTGEGGIRLPTTPWTNLKFFRVIIR